MAISLWVDGFSSPKRNSDSNCRRCIIQQNDFLIRFGQPEDLIRAGLGGRSFRFYDRFHILKQLSQHPSIYDPKSWRLDTATQRILSDQTYDRATCNMGGSKKPGNVFAKTWLLFCEIKLSFQWCIFSQIQFACLQLKCAQFEMFIWDLKSSVQCFLTCSQLPSDFLYS